MAFSKKILGIGIGWSDRGEVRGTYLRRDGDLEIRSYDSCNLCGTHAHIGIEAHKAFMFCPRCLNKLTKSNE